MKRIVAFITYQTHPQITPDDALAATALADLKVEAIGVPWNQENVDWQKFDAVILRSCWDYFHHIEQFLSWVDHLDRKNVKLLNPHSVVRWNVEKTYLQDLSKAGAHIVPTVYAFKHSEVSIANVMKKHGWDRAVIKPTVSGTSLHTWVSSSRTLGPDQRQLDALLQQRSMMLQEYLPEIETDGELSLMYFEGQFSHAVRKVPKSGDFRVQNEFGGTWQSIHPDLAVLQQAEQILRAADRDHVYARVDGVMRNGIFILMELEMIEPHLFLQADMKAANRFAHAIEKRVERPAAKLLQR